MFKRKLTTSDFLLITVNLIPLYGVWFEGWDAARMFLVYCMETILIGIFNVIKMVAVTLFVKPTDNWENAGNTSKMSGWFFIFFFIFHYGIFVSVQTGIFFQVSRLFEGISIFNTLTAIPQILGTEGQLMLLIFLMYYMLQTVSGFFFSGEYKTITMGKLMFQPYGRIFIQQFVVILGSLFLGMGATKIFMLIFVGTKIFFELFINFAFMQQEMEKKKLKEQQNILQ